MDHPREQKATTARKNSIDRSVDPSDRARPYGGGPDRRPRYDDGPRRAFNDGRDRYQPHGVKRRQPDDFRDGRRDDGPRRPKYEDSRRHYDRDERRDRQYDHEERRDRRYTRADNRDARREYDRKSGRPGEDSHHGDSPRQRRSSASSHGSATGLTGIPNVPAFGAQLPFVSANASTEATSHKSSKVVDRSDATKQSDHSTKVGNGPALDAAEQEQEEAPALDEDALIEERRKRREAIRAKYKTEPLHQAPEPTASTEVKVVPEKPQVINSSKAHDVEQTERPTPPAQQQVVAKVDQDEDSPVLDMFADDVEDDDDTGPQVVITQDDGINNVSGLTGKQLDKSLLDDWDDEEGYYRIILGEILDKRYQIQTNLGKGVFSAVVRATDIKTGDLVAIKVIRKQETMYKAGLKEIRTLEKLQEEDPEDKQHVIRLIRHFMHKDHLCMVFEHLSINLREVLKKFGRDIGINIRAVRAYAQQMFLALSLLKKCDVLHADLKPDNVLVNENRSQLKVADLGSAFDIKDCEVTDMLVSRFYRAPEIMLGIKGDFALDMWSIGCTLFELYTGRICFTGPTNNQMLKGILECRGKIPNRVLKRATYWAQHFDADGTFLSQEYDAVNRKDVVRRMNIVRPVPDKELRARLFANSKDLSVADAKELSLFADLLDRCLALDPLRRITPNEALRHGFINRSAAAMPAKK